MSEIGTPMPYSTNPAHYPANMIPPIELVATTGREIVIDYDSDRQATGKRLRFYGLKRALREAGHPVSKLPNFELVHFYQRGASVAICHIDNTPEALEDERRIQEAIAKAAVQ